MDVASVEGVHVRGGPECCELGEVLGEAWVEVLR